MEPFPTPAVLLERYADWDWTVAWQLVPEAITYRLTNGSSQVRYLKLGYTFSFPSVQDEAERMEWAESYLPVPSIVEAGSEDGVSWLVTCALPGVDATNDALQDDSGNLVCTLAIGLRQFHQAPIETCPFVFSLDVALAHAERRAKQGHIDASRDFHPEHQHLTVSGAIERLRETRPASEDLVVCHGDYCFPNVMIDGGEVVGFVDLGELGVADRWWDLAVATWSSVWNLGQGYEQTFLDAYGVDADVERIRYYRLLYDVVS